MAGESSKENTVTTNDFLLLKRQFNELLAKQSAESKLSKSKVIIEKDPPKEFGVKLKPTNLPEFNGSRVRYPAWRTAVLDTFRMDWNLFGYDNSRAFLMIYNSLKGGALERAGPFYEAGRINMTRNPEDFIEFLDRLYLDTTRVSQANLDLHSMKMKETERWADFLATWSKKLTEARGDFWPDENKISMLQNAMNKKLTRALIGNHLLPDDDFSEWTRIVNKIGQQVERAEKKAGWPLGWVDFESSEHSSGPRREAFRKDMNRGPSERSNGSKVLAEMEQPAVDSSGDTIMGGVNSARIPGKIQVSGYWVRRRLT